MGDTLGNHTATQDLNMAGYSILNAGSITAEYYTGRGGEILIVPDSSFTGNLVAQGADISLLELAQAVDAIQLTQNVSQGYNRVSVPFSYMDMSKIYTSQAIGWVVERNNTAGYLYTCGGNESASASLVSGQAYVDLVTPPTATGFAPTGFEITIVGSDTSAANCKLDVLLYTTSPSGTSSNVVYRQYAKTVATINTPETLYISPTGAFAAGRLVAELVFYSKSSKSIKILGGSAHYAC